jgi:subtilisin
MRRVLALMSVGALGVALLSAGAGASPAENETARTSGSYIVVLDHGDPGETAADHRREHGVDVRHVYRHALRGYAARMSEEVAERVAADERVAYVDADRRVTASHHRCGHTQGRGGHPDDECDDGSVSGTITDAETGEAVEGVEVAVDGGEQGIDDTDGAGEYAIDDVDGGEREIVASHEDYRDAADTIVVDGDTEWDAALEPEDDGGGGDEGDQTVPWGVERVGAPRAHDSGLTGDGVRAYVLDTGVDVDHADLAVAGGHAVVPCEGDECSADYDDDHGHGTHVAGTVAALDNSTDVLGVAPDAELWAVKVLDDAGAGSFAGVIAGIDWVAEQTASHGAATVANMSFGGTGTKQGTCAADGDGSTADDSLHDAVCNARNEGVIFAAAAGNDGLDAETVVPAAYDDAVTTVSATHDGDDWPVWSNWGDNEADWAPNDTAPVALAAPGVDVESTQAGGGTTTFSGTSMAAPHVAGGAALRLEADPPGADATAFTVVRQTLLEDAESTADWGNLLHDEGFLDLRNLSG